MANRGLCSTATRPISSLWSTSGRSRRNGTAERRGRAAGRVTFKWDASGAHLLQHGTAELPEAPDNVSIIGCDAANGTYFQLYSDERGVCRIYEMSIGNGEWKLWREGEPFSQCFTATFRDDGNMITGRCEIGEDGTNYTTDFDLIYAESTPDAREGAQ
jgi:hypothetical protein